MTIDHEMWRSQQQPSENFIELIQVTSERVPIRQKLLLTLMATPFPFGLKLRTNESEPTKY